MAQWTRINLFGSVKSGWGSSRWKWLNNFTLSEKEPPPKSKPPRSSYLLTGSPEQSVNIREIPSDFVRIASAAGSLGTMLKFMLEKYDEYNGNEMIQLTRDKEDTAEWSGKTKKWSEQKERQELGKLLIGKSKATFLFIVECFMNNILLFMNWDFPQGISSSGAFPDENSATFLCCGRSGNYLKILRFITTV